MKIEQNRCCCNENEYVCNCDWKVETCRVKEYMLFPFILLSCCRCINMDSQLGLIEWARACTFAVCRKDGPNKRKKAIDKKWESIDRQRLNILHTHRSVDALHLWVGAVYSFCIDRYVARDVDEVVRCGGCHGIQINFRIFISFNCNSNKMKRIENLTTSSNSVTNDGDSTLTMMMVCYRYKTVFAFAKVPAYSNIYSDSGCCCSLRKRVLVWIPLDCNLMCAATVK